MEKDKAGGGLCNLNITPKGQQRRECMGYREASGRKTGEGGHSLQIVTFILTKIILFDSYISANQSRTGTFYIASTPPQRMGQVPSGKMA